MKSPVGEIIRKKPPLGKKEGFFNKRARKVFESRLGSASRVEARGFLSQVKPSESSIETLGNEKQNFGRPRVTIQIDGNQKVQLKERLKRLDTFARAKVKRQKTGNQENKDADTNLITQKIEYIMQKPIEERFTTEMGYMSDYILKQVLFFKSLQPELIPLLAEKLQRKVFEKGDKIMIKGEVGDSMFIIYEGEVGIYIDAEFKVCVAKLTPNKVFGEAALQ